jgi:hypothetical protein
MRTYRNLFEQEFSGDDRIMDIAGTGLPLGVKTLTLDKALALLGSGPEMPQSGAPAVEDASAVIAAEAGQAGELSRKLKDFIENEKNILLELRSLLTGGESQNADAVCRLDYLLDEADYLWAHFPDCAGAEGRRPSGTDTNFLKRVRAEIDPFLKLWDMALRETTHYEK